MRALLKTTADQLCNCFQGSGEGAPAAAVQTPPLAKVHEPDSAVAECQQASDQVARGFASVDEDAGVEEPVNFNPTTESVS